MADVDYKMKNHLANDASTYIKVHSGVLNTDYFFVSFVDANNDVTITQLQACEDLLLDNMMIHLINMGVQ